MDCDNVAEWLVMALELLSWSDSCYYSCLEFRKLERAWRPVNLLPGWNLATLRIQGIALAVVFTDSSGNVHGMTWRLLFQMCIFCT